MSGESGGAGVVEPDPVVPGVVVASPSPSVVVPGAGVTTSGPSVVEDSTVGDGAVGAPVGAVVG